MLVRMPLVVFGNCVLNDIEQQKHCGFAEQGHYRCTVGTIMTWTPNKAKLNRRAATNARQIERPYRLLSARLCRAAIEAWCEPNAWRSPLLVDAQVPFPCR